MVVPHKQYLYQVRNGNVILKRPIMASKEIRQNYNQNFFAMEFTALNYVNPTQTIYRYRLEGVDADWREIKSTDGIGRTAYTKLSL